MGVTWFNTAGYRRNIWGYAGWVCGIPGHPGPPEVYGPDEDWWERHKEAFHNDKEQTVRQILSTPIYDPHVHGGTVPQDEPAERVREVDGVEHLTVSEYVRRVDPIQYPVVEELISASGYDRTYVQLGVMAAQEGRLMRVEPVKMYHPDYEAVNGWPIRILDAAWSKFKMRYDIQWMLRDPERPTVPEPVEMPATAISQGLLNQIRAAAERRGVQWAPSRDPRWRGAMAVMLEERPGESPEQALVRRTSAAAALHAIEKEYERR
jgi:hypothetical protein